MNREEIRTQVAHARSAPTPASKAEAEQDKELMGSFTSEDAVLDEDEDD
jgi:hypothetical protein